MVVIIDNKIMLEAFKHLNYSQLAKNSLVSKKFRGVIRTHRHKLALLHVQSINMLSFRTVTAAIKIFDRVLSSEAYNEWAICNNYSKQGLFDDQVSNGYLLTAYAYYKYSNHRERNDRTSVFIAQVELNHDNWPAFQHFVRLATNPFIHIDHVDLTDQNDVLNLLAGTIKPDHSRLQCNEMTFHLKGNAQISLTWAKNYMRCNQFSVYNESDLNQDEALLDFVLTGAHCTPSIVVNDYDLSEAVVDLVEKFMNVKNSDEYHIVESVQSDIKDGVAEVLKREYADFIAKEERDDLSNTHTFEFANDSITKKLQLTTQIFDDSNGCICLLFS